MTRPSCIILLLWALLSVALLVQSLSAGSTDDRVIARGETLVRFTAGRFEIIDREAGVLLGNGSIAAGGFSLAQLHIQIAPDRSKARFSSGDNEKVVIEVTINEGGTVDLAIDCEEMDLLLVEANPVQEAFPVIASNARETDHRVLVNSLGPARIKQASSLFFPHSDTVVTCRSELGGDFEWRGEGSLRAGYLHGKKLALSFDIIRHYFRDTLGIEFYAPMEKRSYWHTAPMVAMTWYGIEGWKNRPAQRREWLEPQVDWVAENLLPYAGELIFQLDDDYPHNDNAFMRDLSDMIRERGLIPGIWFTPFGVAPRSVSEKHPDWFLQDDGGKTLTAFGGVNWSDAKGAPPVLNVTNEAAVEKWYAMFWNRASEVWNFDFFKIDGQPTVAKRYRESANGNGAAGYRQGIEIGREVVGADKFINGCWGTPVDALGIVNGSRTGPDTGNWPHATNVVLRWNFLNNFCWWSDPDAAANLFKATVERTRHNVQARVLTGQQFLTDDVWTKVPDANLDVWQRSHPTLDIRPVNLYPIEDWEAYDLFDLRIAKPWGTWDVVGLFNYDGVATVKKLDLDRLPLEAPEVHVYEYWTATHVGRFHRESKIARIMEPYGGQLFSIVPASDDRPDLISTSRHASQGGLDLAALEWTEENKNWTASGRSEHLVPGDPYELVFATGQFKAVSATCSSGSAAINDDGPVTRVSLDAAGERTLAWSVAFEPLAEPVALFEAPEKVCKSGKTPSRSPVYVNLIGDVSPGRSMELVFSDPRIREQKPGMRIFDGARTSYPLWVDLSGLPPGTIWTGSVKLEVEGQKTVPESCRLRALVPWPENLALRAKATASSIWSEGYEAHRINDADTKTRWNSVQGETKDAWAQLTWHEDVTIDRVVIDECVDHGNRVQAWRIEIGTDKETWLVVARGEEAGRRRIVDLELPVTTRTLRLVVENASEVPTIWELEAYRWRNEEK